MDVLTPEQRRINMSNIKGKNTRPEKIVRSLLHKMGYRFRLHNKNLPGKPDISLPKYKAVVFVNGCFWHRHSGCRYATTPKSRVEFWEEKFAKNIANDAKVCSELISAGWKVIVIWECELKNLDVLKDRLPTMLKLNL